MGGILPLRLLCLLYTDPLRVSPSTPNTLPHPQYVRLCCSGTDFTRIVITSWNPKRVGWSGHVDSTLYVSHVFVARAALHFTPFGPITSLEATVLQGGWYHSTAEVQTLHLYGNCPSATPTLPHPLCYTHRHRRFTGCVILSTSWFETDHILLCNYYKNCTVEIGRYLSVTIAD